MGNSGVATRRLAPGTAPPKGCLSFIRHACESGHLGGFAGFPPARNGARPDQGSFLAWGAVLRILRAVKTGGCADKEDV